MIVVIDEIRVDKSGRSFRYIEYDSFLPNGTPYSEKKYFSTQDEQANEIAEQAKQQRIAELKEIITNKNYLGDDVTVERAELRVLLGM
jgi:hypothetical protein